MNRIQLLDPIVAQRIAAGEVIERPSSVVRELVDNAIDAQATSISVYVQDGGLKRITVIDDGEGIDKEDLPLCCKSHATSKVASLDDLYHLSTMGFRGEALYSIAACAKVTIASSRQQTSPWQMSVDNGVEGPVTPGGPSIGTKVDVEDLFHDIPARRMFLKRPSTEATMCKNVLAEKALAFPDIEFKFYSDDVLRLQLPPASKKDRVLDALATDKNLVRSETLELYDTAGRFSLYAVASTPACYRSDRSHIKIYINNRPVEEYALVQAVIYGYGEMLPGGSFPYCYLFVTVDPTLVDFNIHPAKREVKLRNKAEVHHQVVEMVRTQVRRAIPRLKFEAQQQAASQLELGQQNVQPQTSTPPSGEYTAERDNGYGMHTFQDYSKSSTSGSNTAKASATEQRPSDPTWFAKAKAMLHPYQGHPLDTSTQTPVPQATADRRASDASEWMAQTTEEQDFTYLGQAFNLFLIAQKGEDLYLVDQHAAHERILFDELKARKDIQRLMVPLSFEVDRDVDAFLQENSYLYSEFGMELSRPEDLLWELATLPALCKPVEKAIVQFISTQTGDVDEIEKGLYAIIACHAAIKDGDPVDAYTAKAILDKVFAMEEPCCPHGRTFLVRISKQELWQAVGRT